MKRVLLCFFLMCMTVCMSAQTWSKSEFKGDELAGTESYTAYTYTDENGHRFTFWSNDAKSFRLYASDHGNFFQNQVTQMGNLMTKQIIVGFYDENENLISKSKIYLVLNKGNLHQGDAEGITRKVGKKIQEHLKNTKGYVRFLADLYGDNGNSFNLKVPHIEL